MNGLLKVASKALFKSSAIVLVLLCELTVLKAHAADFTIVNGQTETGTQTIGADAGETGAVEEGGVIATTGDSNSAIISTSNNGVINNHGTITTTGNSSFGIYLNSVTNNTVTNNGSMATSGSNSYGMFTFGGDNSLVNNGSITTSGNDGIGIISFLGDGPITNNGTIVTSGEDAHGILTNGSDGAVVTNNGTITTNGTGAEGIVLNGDNSMLINNGAVIANGAANSLRVSNISGTIINQGYVTSVGGNAIELSAADATLIVKSGSMVEGAVLFSGGGDRVLQYDVSGIGRQGSVLAITGDITGAPTTSITNSTTLSEHYSVVQRDNVVAVVTPDQFGSSQHVIAETVNDVEKLINNRQQLALLDDSSDVQKTTQYASLNSSQNDASGYHNWSVQGHKVAWAEAFGSYQERGQTSDTSDLTVRSGGFLVGVDLPQTNEGIRSGYFMGGFGGNIDIGSFRDLDSLGGIVGGYMGKYYDEYYVSGSLNLGFSNNESHRLTGIDTAKADYTSYFVTPSVTLMRPIIKDGYALIPNITLRYTAQHDGSYTETGSVANQSVDSRTSHALGSRVMVHARMDAEKFDNGSTLETTVRAGLEGTTTIGRNKTEASVLSNDLSFNLKGNNETIDGVLGVNFNFSHSEDLNLYFDAEANIGLNHGGVSENKGATGRFGVKCKF